MNSSISYTVSVRGKKSSEPIISFLDRHCGYVPREKIDSVFGFVEKSTFYGGRPFRGRQVSDRDIENLYKEDIGLRIPLTNHFFSEVEYKRNWHFLEKYHKKGNSIIAVNDDLARAVRRDFPDYGLEASTIKNINTHKCLADVLELYDTAVLPMNLNTDFEFLEKAEPKSRITLFSTAACAYTCSDKTCYRNISRLNKLLCSSNPIVAVLSRPLISYNIGCSRKKLNRALLGMVTFEQQRYIDMGYTRFKVIELLRDSEIDQLK